MPVSRITPVAVAQMPRAVNENTVRSTSEAGMGMGGSHAMGMPVRGWMGTAGSQRLPVKIQQPMLTRIAR